MSKSPDEASIESLLGVLRADVVQPEPPIRRRLGARLARVVLLQLLTSLLLSVFFRPRLFGSKAFAVAVALPVGMALGASGHAWLANQRAVAKPPAVAVGVHVVSGVAPPPVAATASAAEVTAPPAVAPATATVVPSPPSSGTGPSRRPAPGAAAAPRGVGRELSQLEKARTLLSEGRAEETLTLLRRHFARYRHSSFEQERQALLIKALVADHQLVEARARAAVFVRRFPKSTLRSSVESAVAPIP